MADFLHGVETFTQNAGPAPIQEVRTAVTFLVGTAPIHHTDGAVGVNELGLSLSKLDDPKWGPEIAGYSIPQALAAIHGKVGSTVIVVNVFDPTTHKTDVVAADLPITNGQIQLANGDVTTIVVKLAGGAGSALVEGTDYEFDAIKGLVTVIDGGALDAEVTANIAYSYGDPAAIVAADIIGSIDVAMVHTGLQLARIVSSVYGFTPKILITPGYSQLASVRAECILIGDLLRAFTLADVPAGSTRDEIVEGRAAGGDIDLTAASGRLVYCEPHLTVYDKLTDSNRSDPMSPHLAGVIAKTDRELGYWHSPSNKVIGGVLGLESPRSFGINDPQCDVNVINGAGVMSVAAAPGKGLRTWGNRSSVFPGEAGLMTFIAPQRVRDVVDESIELFSMNHIDGPIDDVFIQAVLDDVNEFMRLLISRRAILKGSRCVFDPALNPVSQLSNGQIVFTNIFCPPPPAERMTWHSVVDTTLLSQLAG